MRRTAHILAGLTLCAAMSFLLASCQKIEVEPFVLPSLEDPSEGQPVQPDMPEQDSPEPVAPSQICISIPEDTTLFSYKGHPDAFEYRIEGLSEENSGLLEAIPSAGLDSFTFTRPEEDGTASVNFILSSDNGSFTVNVTTRDTTVTRTVLVAAFSMEFTGLEEGSMVNDEGNGTEICFGVKTNVPDAGGSLSVSTDAEWITVSKAGDGFVATLAENRTGVVRSASIILSDKSGMLPDRSFSVCQDWMLYTPEGSYVVFRDKAFKVACLETADTDGDRQVSFGEASAVKELYVPGRGITDLTGLEMFVNLEFFEAQDNDIRNADMLAELHLLHWLDLKGNRNLESFDVTGCSVYFERCWYEVTPQLRYRTFLRQLNITYDCDMYCAHGDVDFDHRVSTDYSRQGELVKWHEHTVGDGKKVLVFTGLGYLDVDHQDGSFDRVMKDALKLYLEACPKLEEHFEEFDVYMMRHIMRTRDEYVFPGAMWNTEEVKPIKKAYSQERTYILKESYNKVSLPGENKLVLTFSIDIHPNVRVVPAVGTTFVLDNWDKDYNNEYQMYEQLNPVPTLDIDKLNEYGFRNRRLETITVDIVKCGGNVPNYIYNFFGIQ